MQLSMDPKLVAESAIYNDDGLIFVEWYVVLKSYILYFKIDYIW